MAPLVIDCTAPGQTVAPFWNRVVCSDRVGLSLRADVREHIAMAVKQCGFGTLRQHGMFHDDMFVWHNRADPFHFGYLDSVYDFYLALGLRPFVELGFSPAWLASNDNTVFAARCHGAPPSDYAAWARLVSATVMHLRDRYGIDEICQWYFEAWNEPNLSVFWKGTQQQYFDLYRVTAEAVKSVDARLRVGGPATSCFNLDQNKVFQPPWVREFIDYCVRMNTPVDFISTHPYPTNFPFMPELNDWIPEGRERDATRNDLMHLRNIVRASPFPAAEIHCNEWSSAPGWPMHVHDHPFAATFTLESNLRSIGLVDSLAHWALSDVSEEAVPSDRGEFKGGWGLVTQNGIRKPCFHAYAFLNRLGPVMLHNGDGIVVFRHDAGIQVLLYNHHHYQTLKASWATMETAEAMIGPGEPRVFALQLAGLPAEVRVRRTQADRDHGWARPLWVEMGSPASPTARQIADLRAADEPQVLDQTVSCPGGVMNLRETVASLGMLLLEISIDNAHR